MVLLFFLKTLLFVQISHVLARGQNLHCFYLYGARDQCCLSTPAEYREASFEYYYHDRECEYIKVVQNEWRKFVAYYPQAIPNATFLDKMLYTVQRPPPKPPGATNLTITIKMFEAEELSISEQSQNIEVNARVMATWQDPRFNWGGQNSRTWRTSNGSLLWHPDFSYPSPTRWEYPPAEYVVENGGRVTMRFEFQKTEMCDFDYDYYPFDEHSCCVHLHAEDFYNSLTYALDENVTDYPFSQDISKLWKDGVVSVHKTTKTNEYDDEIYDLCYDFKRASASATTEMLLPLAVTILMTVLLPMFTSWKMQAISKIFCLALQFACSFVLTLETKHLQFGGTTPRLLRLHELIIWTTTFNLIGTLVLWNLSKRKFQLPPPASVIKAANLVNAFLWWSSSEEQDDDEKIVIGVQESIERSTSDANQLGEFQGEASRVDQVQGAENSHDQPKSSNIVKLRSDTWRDVWCAANRVLQLVFAYIYIIGCLALVLHA